MPTWPASVPQRPLQESYSRDPQGNVLHSEMDAGPGQSRRLFTAKAMYFTLPWLMDKTQLDTFEAFWENDIADGSVPFDMPHPETGATVQAIPLGRYSVKAAEGFWNVQFRVAVLP